MNNTINEKATLDMIANKAFLKLLVNIAPDEDNFKYRDAFNAYKKDGDIIKMAAAHSDIIKAGSAFYATLVSKQTESLENEIKKSKELTAEPDDVENADLAD